VKDHHFRGQAHRRITSSPWAVAAQEHSDFGPLRDFYPVHEQFREVWAVVDHPGKILSIETGVGSV